MLVCHFFAIFFPLFIITNTTSAPFAVLGIFTFTSTTSTRTLPKRHSEIGV